MLRATGLIYSENLLKGLIKLLLCINYADEKFRPWQQIQTLSARYFGVDEVLEYSPQSLDAEFVKKNKFILDQPRGAGYWVWKPYIIKDALSRVKNGDYVFYVDSGAMFVNNPQLLIDTMNKNNVNIMVFGGVLNLLERNWTKRDAFILMDCDEEKYWNSGQIASGYILLKKSPEAENFIDDFLKYAQDPRIITDMPNQLGVENLPGFKENRHDQTIVSLLAKKRNLPVFRDPSQFRTVGIIPDEIIKRSTYPQIVFTHRRWLLPLQKSFEDILRIYACEPRLCEGVRSAKFLLEEGMIREAWELLKNLTEKYSVGNDQAWAMVLDDIVEIFSVHRSMGAPHPEAFQPLLCIMMLQSIRRNITPDQILKLMNVAKYIENKSLIPKEFLDSLKYLLGLCLEKSIDVSYMSPIEILEYYNSLNLSELPFEFNNRRGGLQN